MPAPITLTDAKTFLRAADPSEDGLVGLLISAAQTRIEDATGLVLTDTSPAPLRLAILLLAAHAYEHRDEAPPPFSLIEPWLAPYRIARL